MEKNCNINIFTEHTHQKERMGKELITNTRVLSEEALWEPDSYYEVLDGREWSGVIASAVNDLVFL